MFKEHARTTLEAVIATLMEGARLAPHFRDHQLEGDLKRYRECHIGGDMLLAYQVETMSNHLFLVDIGDHSHVFGD